MEKGGHGGGDCAEGISGSWRMENRYWEMEHVRGSVGSFGGDGHADEDKMVWGGFGKLGEWKAKPESVKHSR